MPLPPRFSSLDATQEILSEENLISAANDSALNQNIQSLLFKWRDRGGHYDSEMIDMVYKIIDMVREK